MGLQQRIEARAREIYRAEGIDALLVPFDQLSLHEKTARLEVARRQILDRFKVV